MRTIAALDIVAFAAFACACSAQNSTILSTVDAGGAGDAQPTEDPDLSTATVTIWRDIGQPCTPADEEDPRFAGYAAREVNIETRSEQCASRICLVNHYQGRLSCPAGQVEPASGCVTSGAVPMPVTVPVPPSCSNRTAGDAVYCTCRCDGPPSEVPFCQCGQGFTCAKLLEPIPSLGSVELAGSYCVRSGTEFDPSTFTCEP